MEGRHIDEAELAGMWVSDVSITDDGSVAIQQLIAHSQECSTCKALLDSYLAVEQEIDSLTQQSGRESNDRCPREDMWLRLLADVLDERQATEFLRHATECPICAHRLAAAQKYMSGDLEEIPGRRSSTPEWQERLAQEIILYPPSLLSAKTERERRRRSPFWTLGVPVTVGVLVVAIVGIWIFGTSQPQRVEKLLGQAYSQNRTLEPRISQASYGPIQLERRANIQSQINKPPSLLKAEEMISRHLQKESSDPLWLDLKGRADLLDGNYQSALKSFQDALQSQPDSDSFLTDAATAYFELAEIADRPQDYGRAIELLGKVLKRKPDDSVALFNRALASEKMFLYHQAIEDWQRYIQIDPKGAWSQEATRHLNALRQKLAEHEKVVAEPLLSPAALLVRAAIESHDRAIELVSRRGEEYLETALLDWLPTVFSQAHSGMNSTKSDDLRRTSPLGQVQHLSGSPAALNALTLLSEASKLKHGDVWLEDLLISTQHAALGTPVSALKKALSANSKGDFGSAKIESLKAAKLFRLANNEAGEIRAQLERVYALERSFQEKTACLMEAGAVANHLRKHHYPWIEGQLYLEESNCWSQVGDFGKAYAFLEKASIIIQRSEYPILNLRAIGMAAALQSRQGNLDNAYSLDRSGLVHYWNGFFPPMRAYQFYSDMGTAAEEAEQWNFALLLAKEAVNAATAAAQPLAEAFAHHRFGKIALAVGNRALAARAFGQASILFSSLPQTRQTKAYAVDAEIELARLEVAMGDIKGSWKHLSAAGTQVLQNSHYSVTLSYYRTLGELYRLSGNREEAIKALLSATTVAERGLTSLSTERERLTWARNTRQVYRDLATTQWQANDVAGSLQTWELYRAAALGAFGARGKSEHITGKEKTAGWDLSNRIFQDLPFLRRQTTLSYLQLSDGLIVWVFDDHGLTTKWVAISQQEMEHLARRFHDECSNRYSNLVALRQDAHQLFDLLIAPVEDRLSRDRILVIEPDETIATIPMVALLDHFGHYLGENHSVVTSPGLVVQRRLRHARAFLTEEHALVIGTPAQDDQASAVLAPLPHADEEAQFVASKFRFATLLTGRRATLEVVERELPRATVFHFAGHGVVFDRQGGLLLAPSRHSTAESSEKSPIFNTTNIDPTQLRKLHLAVFSACLTAGEGENGLGTSGNLVEFFLRAGVPHVLASQWNVDSGTTEELMQVFYDTLLAGGTVSESMVTATARVRSKAETAHPYYWAAFMAFGT